MWQRCVRWFGCVAAESTVSDVAIRCNILDSSRCNRGNTEYARTGDAATLVAQRGLFVISILAVPQTTAPQQFHAIATFRRQMIFNRLQFGATHNKTRCAAAHRDANHPLRVSLFRTVFRCIQSTHLSNSIPSTQS